jgi:hypothetical protein
VPGSYLLGVVMHVGLVGMWGAGCIYAIGACAAMSLKFKQGKWKLIKL